MKVRTLMGLIIVLIVAGSSINSMIIDVRARSISTNDNTNDLLPVNLLNNAMINSTAPLNIRSSDIQKLSGGRFSLMDTFKFVPYLNEGSKKILTGSKAKEIFDRVGNLPSSILNRWKGKIFPSLNNRSTPSRLIIKMRDFPARFNFRNYFSSLISKTNGISVLSDNLSDISINTFGNSHFGKVFVVSLPKGIDIYNMISLISKNPYIEYVEPDYQFKLYGYPVYPNDPLFSQQWYLNNSSNHDIDAPEAWHTTTGNDNVIVAVIDSGVDYNHEDLSGNIWINTGEIPNNGIDDDHNGYIDDTMGWNFVLNNTNITDNINHGTLCAGLIGAIGNNSKGISGLSWHCRIMPVKCFDYVPVSFASVLAKGIVYAADNGADIISLSWGSFVDSKLIRDAIDYAESKGCIIVAAAGNSGTRIRTYPAAYPGVIAVGATDKNDSITDFSNWGYWVDISAPGKNIISTGANGDYLSKSGTSFSTPLVAGTIALMLSIKPDATKEEILTSLDSGANPIFTTGYRYAGVGRLNVNNSLSKLTGIVALLNKVIGGSVVSGVVEIRGSVYGPGFSKYHLYYGKGVYPSMWHEFYNSSLQVSNGILANLNTTALDDGLYTIKLEVIDNSSRTYVDTLILTIDNVNNRWFVGGSGPENLTSIQDAILESGDGDEIFVYSGIYQENIILIDRSVKIMGENRYNTQILPATLEYPAAYIIADRVTLENMTLKSRTIDVIINNANEISILGCKFVGMSFADVLMSNSTDDVIKENTFMGAGGVISIPVDLEKLTQGVFDFNLSLVGNFLSLKPISTNIVIENNTNISMVCLVSSNENKIVNNTYLGSLIAVKSSNNTVTNNNLHYGVYRGGIFVYDSYNNNVKNNTVNGKNLVYCEDESGKVIEDGGQIILVNCSDITIRNVTASQPTLSAVEIFNSENCIVEDLNVSIADFGVVSIRSIGTTVINSSFHDVIDFGVVSIEGKNTTIIGNRFLGPNACGITVIDIKYADLKLDENGLDIRAEFNDGVNTIKDNVINNVDMCGILVISLADNDIRDNIINADSHILSAPYLGIADISMKEINFHIRPNRNVYLDVIFGKEKQNLVNNRINKTSFGLLLVSDSNTKISRTKLMDVQVGMLFLSLKNVSINLKFGDNLEGRGKVYITFSNRNVSISDSHIVSYGKNANAGIIAVSNSNSNIENNLIEYNKSSIGIINVGIQYINISTSVYLEGNNFDQFAEIKIKGGNKDCKILNNTLRGVSAGIAMISNGEADIENNVIMNANIYGIIGSSINLFDLKSHSLGRIKEYPALDFRIKNSTTDTYLTGGFSLYKIHNNSIYGGISAIDAVSCSLSIMNNTLSPSNSNVGIGILSSSIEEVDAKIDVLRDNLSMNITFAQPVSRCVIEKNKIRDAFIGVLVVSNGFDNISTNDIRDAKGVGLWYNGLKSIQYKHISSPSSRRENIKIYGSANRAFIENNSIRNVNILLGNISSGIVVASESGVTVKDNKILNVSNNTKGILIINPNLNISIIHNITNITKLNITVFTQSGNHRIENNTIAGQDGCGISIWYSSENEILLNNIENLSIGISIPSDPIRELNISIMPEVTSNDNLIYHNNFRDNSIQAVDNWSNIWNLSYPSGGNYWSDYSGRDIYMGVNQNIPGKDRIGDTPYNISGNNNRDFYPLMQEYGEIPPASNFIFSPTHPYVGDGINFTDRSIDIDGDLVSWHWEFGDGNTSNERNPDHTYSHPGIYMINLTVIDDKGLSDTSSLNVTVYERDIIKPTISNVAINPSIQAFGGFVNISCIVQDNVAVQKVKINVSYPNGTSQNISMDKLNGDKYCLNQSYNLLGTYNFTIWAIDTSNNSNLSSKYNFEIIDVTPPTIIDNTPSNATTGDSFVFNVTVTNAAEVRNVYVEYWYNNSTHLNESMTNTGGNQWIKEIIMEDTLQPLHYFISAIDSYNNWNRTLEKKVEIKDNDEPGISNISISPNVQEVEKYVNISCIVQDNIDVNDVWIMITDPLNRSVEIKMNKIGDIYYINDTYSILGNYSFVIFANDTSGNLAHSPIFIFKVVRVNISIKLKKPVERGFYFNDKYFKFFRPKITIIIGKMTFSTEVNDGIGNVTVYFYINGKLKAKVEKPPYAWTFNERMFGRRCTIKVVAEDDYGHRAEYSMQARIFNLGIFSK